jgi:hypothetical protein
MKSFKETRQYLENVPYINLGGCGIAALALYDAAQKEGKKVDIAYLYHKWWGNHAREHNHKFKEGKVKKAHACEHVLVRVGNRYYDSTGVVNIKYASIWHLIDKGITRDHLVASVNNKDVWNDTFERKKYLPKIEKFIGKKLLVKI